MSCFSVCDRRYNYSKEDDEMFKEFYDIANVFIPNILKQSSSPAKDGKETYRPAEDPQFFAYLLQFHDGICLWEEGSHTPVLHADWAKKLVQSISKISPACRASLASTPKPEPRAPVPQALPSLPEKKPVTSNQAPGDLQNNSTSNSEQGLGTSHQVPKTGDAVSGATSSANDKEATASKPGVVFSLRSTKMKEMRRLLTDGGKLNTSAIKLQLTAQSQVSVPKNRRRSSFKADDYVYDFDEDADKEEEEEEEEED